MPAASINGIGFAFKDYDTVWKAMDGKLGAYVRGEIDKRGLIAMDKMWDNGFRQITTSTQPIKTPADLKGFKIRVPVSPALDLACSRRSAPRRSASISPRSIPRCRPRSSRARRTRCSLIQIAKLYEVQKYCSMTNHMWDGFWMLANKRGFAGLPPDLQERGRARAEQVGAATSARTSPS